MVSWYKKISKHNNRLVEVRSGHERELVGEYALHNDAVHTARNMIAYNKPYIKSNKIRYLWVEAWCGVSNMWFLVREFNAVTGASRRVYRM